MQSSCTLIGNHEAAPCNLFTPHSVRQSLWTSNWLYKYLASDEAWGGWLLRDPATAADIEYYASYSTLVRSKLLYTVPEIDLYI